MRFTKKLTQITVIILTVCIGLSFAGLVAEYNFEGDPGTADASGNNPPHDAMIAGLASCVDGGIQGKALQYASNTPFTSTGNYFGLPDQADFDLNTMTLEAWVKLDQLRPQDPQVVNIITKWSANTTPERSYVLNIDARSGGGLRPHFLISPDGHHPAPLISPTVISIGVWYHLVATFDGQIMRIYINGNENCSKNLGAGFTAHAGTAPLRIGIDGDGNAPMRGLIDNAKIYNVALTDAEVAAASVKPPFADAGPDQAVTLIGTTVQLDGTQSWDPVSNPLTFLWEITEQPVGSGAVLDDPTSNLPTFIADVNGSYTIELVVSNDWASSLADEVIVSFDNIKPVAEITGGNVSCMVNESVILDGSGSSDDNGDILSFNWQLTKPEGSSTIIADATSVEASVTPDVAGEYVISLTVNDGTIDSDPATVTIAVITVEDATTETLQEASEILDILPTSALKNKTLAKTTTNMINSVLLKIDDGDIEGAYNQLKNAILKKTDGCAESGSPDKNDWIKDCESQELVYPVLIEALDLLFGLLP